MSFTEQEYIEFGMRRRAIPLIRQSEVALQLFLKEPQGFIDLLPDPKIDEKMTLSIEQINEAMKDRQIAEADAKGATRVQDEQMAKGKIWLRKATKRNKRGVLVGVQVPEEMQVHGRLRSVNTMLSTLKSFTDWMKTNNSQLASAGKGLDALIAEGVEIHTKLSNYDAKQEAMLIQTVPAAVRVFWKTKGELYIQLKILHNAAKEFYAADLEKSAQYNMDILYA
ncbi:MAG: hypothetical protein HUU55_00800 [Myxococcales bacterium]|nr:hypothetical protein [Myxococcales bacterium]